jgi:hypothetical protein
VVNNLGSNTDISEQARQIARCIREIGLALHDKLAEGDDAGHGANLLLFLEDLI